MSRKYTALTGGAVLVLAIIIFLVKFHTWSQNIVLTGIVTTNDVIVSPQVGGQIQQLLVTEGDHVSRNQLLAILSPEELQADSSFYAHSADVSGVQVQVSQSALRFQELQTADQIHQAEATLAAALAQQRQAQATLTNAKQMLDREEALFRAGAVAQQDLDQLHTAYAVAQAQADAAGKAAEAQRANVELARANAEQVASRRAALSAARQQHSASRAESVKAAIRLGYSELRAPIDGLVDVCAARRGEVVNAGQPVLTLVDPNDLWVRADVEESYISRIRLGDQMTVRLPSGESRSGTVFYRGVDADFATQRDVSRSKRDIKTFEIRLRVDNRDRRLALGMTAYVLLPTD